MKAFWNRTRSRSRRGSEIQPPAKETIPPLPQPSRPTQSAQPTFGNVNRAVRPVLVGVSRNGEPSRPGTAGSLQNAVSRAADKTSQEFSRGHTRTKSPRYVDIFSVSSMSASHSMTSTYNEEIAERNLDTRVARGEQYYPYLPISKYQEQVAIRNSYQSSSEPPRSSHDRQHRSWISSGTESGPSKGNTPHTSWFQENSRPTSHIPPVTNQQPLPPIHDDQRSTSTNAAGVNQTIASYNLSKAEVSQPRPMESSQFPTRSSSRMSSASHNVINLPHRTIMDLTAEDEADGPAPKASQDIPTYSAHAAAESSPSTSRRSMDTATETETERSPTTAQEVTPITPSTPDRILIQGHDGKTVSIPKSASSFSMISTVASFSPTSQKRAEKEPATEHARSVALESPRLAKHRLSMVPEKASDDDLRDDTKGSADPVEAPLVIDEAEKVVTQPQATPNHFATTVEKPLPKMTPQQSSNNLHTSPESLQSIDYINPSAAFGVRTRDFAVTPSKASLKPDHGANTSAKVSKVNGTSIEPEPATVKAGSTSPYSFDEEAFKRKQEQARAALIKLQQSLNEEFIIPPRTQSAPRTNRMNGVGQRKVPTAWNASDPHGPVAPSSIPYQGNSVDDNRGRTRSSSSQGLAHSDMTDSTSGSASAVTIRAVGRGTLQPLRSRPQVAPRAYTVDSPRGKGKGKESDIEAALFDLQRTAEEISGPVRGSSAQPRPPRSPLRDRKVPNNQGIFGYGFGQGDYVGSISQTIQTPTSPGEVSLSNFPSAPNPTIPREPPPRTRPPMNTTNNSRPGSSAGFRANNEINGDPFIDKAPTNTIKRRGSTTSQASHMTSTSQYSIPFHMIPERGSSNRLL